MSNYPLTRVSPKQHRMHKVYATTAGTVKPARLQPQQIKGPNMFKKMIRGLVAWSMKESHQEDLAISSDSECRISATGIRFEVYRANGGTVVETRRHDRRTGDNIYELHVIASDQDIGEQIGKIITMEALKA